MRDRIRDIVRVARQCRAGSFRAEPFFSSDPRKADHHGNRHVIAVTYKRHFNLCDRFNRQLALIAYPFKTNGAAGKVLIGYVQFALVNAHVLYLHDRRRRPKVGDDAVSLLSLRDFCEHVARDLSSELGPTPTGAHTSR